MPTPSAELLYALHSGKPITGEDGQRLFGANNAIVEPLRYIASARGRGAQRERATFWLTGCPGNGKTQSLRQLIHQLSTIDKDGKAAVAVFDFDKESNARRRDGIVKALVSHCLFNGMGIGGLKDAQEAAVQRHVADFSSIKALAFAIDSLTLLTGLQPVFFGASKLLAKVTRLAYPKRWTVRKKLRERWGKNTQLVEFLATWADYILDPTPDRQGQVGAVLNMLESNNQLFSLFGYALQESKYSTLVIIVDELNAGDSLEGLKVLWDEEVNMNSTVGHSLNLAFVLAGTDAAHAEAMNDPKFARRFCTTPCGHTCLNGPTIHPENWLFKKSCG